MQALILTIHILACVVLVVVVLLQAGKEGMGVIFGGGSSSLFGSTGAGGFLTKLTAFVGALFLITSLGYNAYIKAPSAMGSAMDGVEVQAPKEPEIQIEEPAAATNAENASLPATPLVDAAKDQAATEGQPATEAAVPAGAATNGTSAQ